MLRDLWFWLFVVTLIIAWWLCVTAWHFRGLARRRHLPAFPSMNEQIRMIIELRLAVRRLYYLVHHYESGQSGEQTLTDARQLLEGTEFEIPAGE